MHAIEVVDLRKSYASSDAVQGICFAVEAGTLTVILGPSGCGKSRTLRLIAGLETAHSGKILIGGRDVTAFAPAQRSLSMVFQFYALFPHLTVAENIVFGLRVGRARAVDRTRRLQKAAALLGIETLLERKPSQLSGGQQQRVALGRAIIAETPVCLMDEPLSKLDAQLRQEMRTEIRSLQKKLGITMVYVTHDQIEAMTMADRVILLNGGQIEQNGTPVELYETPANTFVARFIGPPADEPVEARSGIQRRDHRWNRRTGCIARCLRGRHSWRVAGTHPTRVRERGVRAAVDGVEYLGGDSLVYCRSGALPLAVRAQGKVGLARGDAAWLTWVPGAQHFFQPGGARLAAPARHEFATQFA
jgi:sn-glycerol 3-phosphate transport system ATP-binding protein